MPGKLDSVMVPLAQKLIGDFGASATYSVVVSTFSAATGKTTESTFDYAVTITPPAPFQQRRIDGTVIKEGDLQTQIAAADVSFTPNQGDNLTFKGEKWQVVGYNPIYSGEQIALFELQLRN